MLTTLLIRNLALIEKLEIELDHGLNVITGETGAGKSIMIGAIQLLLGRRADKAMIRSGSDGCEVSAVVALPDNLQPMINLLLETAGVSPCEDGQLILNRQIRDPGGRNFINGSPVTLQLLKQLGEILLDLHGPYDNQSLLRTAHQLDVLDDFTGLEALRHTCNSFFEAWKAWKEKLAALDSETPAPELLEYLRFQRNEIEQAGLRPGEDEELTARHAVVANSHQVLQITQAVTAKLSGQENSLLDQTADTLRTLYDLERIDAETGKQFVAQLDSISSQLRELDHDINAYAQRVEVDPAEFQRMEDRLAELRRIKRKYGGTIESALAHGDECRERLRKLENFDGYRAEIQAGMDAAEAELRKCAGELTRKRKAGAKKLGPEITDKLKGLGFPHCEFGITLENGVLGPTGGDVIEFLFAPNPGEGRRPLRDIASSGEIARVMLALKAVLANADHVPILVFDEVDANIGGVVANRVGEELCRLGSSHQVICITHQPQVAAVADRHFVVSKHTVENRTFAEIAPLNPKARVNELVRMLGGEEGAKAARKHAEELIRRGATVRQVS